MNGPHDYIVCACDHQIYVASLPYRSRNRTKRRANFKRCNGHHNFPFFHGHDRVNHCPILATLIYTYTHAQGTLHSPAEIMPPAAAAAQAPASSSSSSWTLLRGPPTRHTRYVSYLIKSPHSFPHSHTHKHTHHTDKPTHNSPPSGPPSATLPTTRKPRPSNSRPSLIKRTHTHTHTPPGMSLLAPRISSQMCDIDNDQVQSDV